MSKDDKKHKLKQTRDRKPRPATPAQGLLTLSQIFLENGIPTSTTRYAITHGELACVRLGKRMWVMRADRDAWLARNRILYPSTEVAGLTGGSAIPLRAIGA